MASFYRSGYQLAAVLVIHLTISSVIPDADSVSSINWIGLKSWDAQTWNVSSGKRNWRSAIESACWSAVRQKLLSKEQARVCTQHPQLMVAVWEAARSASTTCQDVFSDRRWNCSSVELIPRKTPDLTRGTREQAFVYALASASLTRAVARACASGQFKHCACGSFPRHPPDGNFKWGGCGDDVKYGKRFAKSFTDASLKNLMNKKDRVSEISFEWKQTHVNAAVNIHNNRAGRKATELSLQTQCKCHGVSGSCNVKTCWRALPSMDDIGHRLQRQYGMALEVVPRRRDMRGKLPLWSVATNSAGRSGINDHDLIYTNKSPDYCTADHRFGSFGTRGRSCNASATGHDSCSSMCCGRGHVTSSKYVVERCHCKYYWCCQVRCKTCRRLSSYSTCL